MNLIDLISYFRGGGVFEDFCRENSLSVESEVIEIYAKQPINVDSDLGFFTIEETGGRIEFQSKDRRYHNLFDFFYFLEVIEDLEEREEPSDEELARRLYLYAVKDA